MFDKSYFLQLLYLLIFDNANSTSGYIRVERQDDQRKNTIGMDE